jgi:hypothetical protein
MGRRGRYAAAKLIEEHGDAKLTDLLTTLANCQTWVKVPPLSRKPWPPVLFGKTPTICPASLIPKGYVP